MPKMLDIYARDAPFTMVLDDDGCAVYSQNAIPLFVRPNCVCYGDCQIAVTSTGGVKTIVNESYVCGFCGTPHNNLSDYAACVSQCSAIAERKAAEEKKQKLKAEKENRAHEIRAAEKHLNALYDAWHRDYGWRWTDPCTEALRIISMR